MYVTKKYHISKIIVTLCGCPSNTSLVNKARNTIIIVETTISFLNDAFNENFVDHEFRLWFISKETSSSCC